MTIGNATTGAVDGVVVLRRRRRELGRSIWLYLLLEQWADGAAVKAGEPLTARLMADGLGVGERQARRDLQRLRKSELIQLRNTGRGFSVHLRKGLVEE